MLFEFIRITRNLRASFWFLPTVMVFAAVGAAVLCVQLDRWMVEWLGESYSEYFGMTEQGGRDLLAAIASSMITVAGITFSITIVTLSLASSQYTSRVLRNFLRDRGNQMALGMFVAVFVYCLTVLSIITSDSEEKLIPPLAVLGGVALAFCGIGFLIYFIHHVAYSIQASTIIQGIAEETLCVVDVLFPVPSDDQPSGVGEGTQCLVPDELRGPRHWHAVYAHSSGFIQNSDLEHLIHIAETHSIVIRTHYSVGDFLIQDTPLVSIHRTDDGAGDEAAARVMEALEIKIHRCFVIRAHRTIESDVGFGIRQLVDIAVKALSPGVNDTTTANISLNYLTVILARVIQGTPLSACRSTDRRLRVIIYGPTFPDLLGECYEQIRQNAGGNVRVLDHLVHSIRTIAPLTTDPQRLEALRFQVSLIAEVVERTIAAPADLHRLRGDCARMIARLEGRGIRNGRESDPVI